MKKYTLLLLVLFGIVLTTQAQEDKYLTTLAHYKYLTTEAQEDKYLWLEEVDNKKALEFVEKQNKATVTELSAEKDYQDIYNKNLAILNSTEKITYITIYGNYAYNFWKDKDHVRGIWRRTTSESYKSGKPVWETLLDIDEIWVPF